MCNACGNVVKMDMAMESNDHMKEDQPYSVVDHMMKNYDKVLKVEGEVGAKKFYDPRAWMKAAEKSMTERIITATSDLKSAGKSILLTKKKVERKSKEASL